MSDRVEYIELSNLDLPCRTDPKIGRIGSKPVSMTCGENDAIAILGINPS